MFEVGFGGVPCLSRKGYRAVYGTSGKCLGFRVGGL